MTRLCALNILKLLGIAVFLAFVMQLVVVEAEHFGLFDCESISAFLASSEKTTKDVPAQCCHTSCCGHITGIFPSYSQIVSSLHHGQMVFALTDEHALDGPVKAIDIPPQLS